MPSGINPCWMTLHHENLENRLGCVIQGMVNPAQYCRKRILPVRGRDNLDWLARSSAGMQRCPSAQAARLGRDATDILKHGPPRFGFPWSGRSSLAPLDGTLISLPRTGVASSRIPAA